MAEQATVASVFQELAKHAPSFIWGGIVIGSIYTFRDVIKDQLISLRSFKAAGVEFGFAERSMEKAAELAGESNVVVESTIAKPIKITQRDRERAIARALRCSEALKNKRLLWIDDVVTNNRLERDMLEVFGVKIEQVQDNAKAFQALKTSTEPYDAILSDIDRGQGEPDGIAFLEDYRKWSTCLSVIFYISKVDENRSLPVGAFGLTNRPDELVHLVIDALERRG